MINFEKRLLEQKVSVLEKENDKLRAKIRELSSMIVPDFIFPPEWLLPRREKQILTMLFGLPRLTKERYYVLVDDENVVDDNTLESHASKLRKKLSQLGLPITIYSKRFEGYWLDADGKRYLEQFRVKGPEDV